MGKSREEILYELNKIDHAIYISSAISPLYRSLEIKKDGEILAFVNGRYLSAIHRFQIMNYDVKTLDDALSSLLKNKIVQWDGR